MELASKASPQDVLTSLSNAANAAAGNDPFPYDFSKLPTDKAMTAVNSLAKITAENTGNPKAYIPIYSDEEIAAASAASNSQNPIG